MWQAGKACCTYIFGRVSHGSFIQCIRGIDFFDMICKVTNGMKSVRVNKCVDNGFRRLYVKYMFCS